MTSGVDTSVAAFADYIQRFGSPSTARKYREAATQFLKVLKHNRVTSYEQMPRDILQKYVDTLMGQNYAASSVHVHLAGVQRYIEWLKKQGLIIPELLTPDKPKPEHRMRDSLSVDDMSVYFEQAEELLKDPVKTAVILLPCTGLRAIEMAELPLSAIHSVVVHLENGGLKKTLALRVIGKGNKERSVPILDEGVQALMSYLSGERCNHQGPWVFPGMVSKMNKNGARPMSVRFLRDGVVRVREPLGMDITPHTLRRTYLTSLHRMGVDPATIAKIAGHANIQTLFRHYLDLDEQDLLKAVHSKGPAWG